MKHFGTPWQDALRQGGREPVRGMGGMPPMPRDELPDDDPLDLDMAEYKPWVLQRGGRPAMMLHLRRYEPRSGLWMGWQLAYPHFVAAEYIGDRMLSLDFGTRQFVIEGRNLDELVRHLQQGSVVSVQEHARDIWPQRQDGPLVSIIRKIGSAPEPSNMAKSSNGT